MTSSFLSGSAATPFGHVDGGDTLGLMTQAATAALDDAGLGRDDIDGLVCGYSTALPHLMLATVFAEHFGLRPTWMTSVQLGGATGLAMLVAADQALGAGAATRVLVVAGEDRLSGPGRSNTVQTLAQVGHPVYEVPLGPTVPAYYGLLASRYLQERIATEADLAELAVLMRARAGETEGAHMVTPISVGDVLDSRPIASPLKLLDCCPVSDGGAALIVTAEPTGDHPVAVAGTGQATTHQHVTAAPSLLRTGAAASAGRALEQAGVAVGDLAYAAIYDSFTVTLALLLEELGLAPDGQAGRLAADGWFSPGGRLPLNTHGGLLSYGHCGVAGAMAHTVEAHRQLTGRAGPRNCLTATGPALLHGDGGVLSAHVSVVVTP